MAPAAAPLSLSECDRIYGHEAGWEYWFGEARRKPLPTHLHGLLQILLGELLQLAGYISSAEAELCSAPDWHPRPDVYGCLHEITEKYATQPVDVVFEVLSEGEDIETKCQQYSRINIPQIFVFDPQGQGILEWDGRALQPVIDVSLAKWRGPDRRYDLVKIARAPDGPGHGSKVDLESRCKARRDLPASSES